VSIRSWLGKLFQTPLISETHSPVNRDIAVVDNHGRRTLRVNGIEQTGKYVDALFRQGLRYLRHWHNLPVKSIVVFGVGGGGVLFQLQNIYPDAYITGVDKDSEVIGLSKKYFGLNTLTNTKLVVCDARDFVKKKSNIHRFDLVVIDIYIANDVPAFVTENAFLHDVKQILHPDGAMMMNYFSFSDQPAKSGKVFGRLSRIFQLVESKRILRNIFFFVLK
jgi:spermidine synthase